MRTYGKAQMEKHKKVKHHYIARYYLEGFSDVNKMVWTFNKINKST